MGTDSIHYSLHIPTSKQVFLFRYLDYTYSNTIKVSIGLITFYMFCLILYYIFLVLIPSAMLILQTKIPD